MVQQAIQFRFQEDISLWLDALSDEQLKIVQKNLYIVNSVRKLKNKL